MHGTLLHGLSSALTGSHRGRETSWHQRSGCFPALGPVINPRPPRMFSAGRVWGVSKAVASPVPAPRPLSGLGRGAVRGTLGPGPPGERGLRGLGSCLPQVISIFFGVPVS